MEWPQNADHKANAEELVSQLNSGGFRGVVVLTAPQNGNPEKESALRGGEYVHHLVRIARELPDIAGEPARLYVLTRNAQSVVHGDLANLEQVGLRGLMRVIGTEHPHLRATQIDLDDKTDAGQVRGNCWADPMRTKPRGGTVIGIRRGCSPTRCAPTSAAPPSSTTEPTACACRSVRLVICESMELVAFDRVPPGRGEIEVAVTASSINFADVLVAFGRYPSFEGHLPQLGTDFAGVVTAVGPDVTEHQVGDHVGGMSPDGCWGTFVTCDARRRSPLPAGLTDEDGGRRAHRVRDRLVRPARPGPDLRRDKVLIHSATGGVGQAAIAIARAAGAEIFATAGSEQRRDLLRDMGIEHVYDSRSTDFADQIRKDTDGYGVDIVLNSLPGAAQRAGSNCWPSADASSRSASATSTATPGWGCSRSAGTCRSTPSTWAAVRHPPERRP